MQVLGKVTDAVAAAATLVRAELNAAVPPPAVLQRMLLPEPTEDLASTLAAAVSAVHHLCHQSAQRQECTSFAGGFEVRA